MMMMPQSATNSFTNIDLLLQAAQYVENQGGQRRDPDHVYAASPNSYRENNHNNLNRPRKSTRRMQNRSSHNELEKNRRAHLRGCLDSLKSIVPLNRDSTRHTTLGLLNQASELIKSLERRHLYYKNERERLKIKNQGLRNRLRQLEIRPRRDSTGSSWSSGRSESSNDSDKDDEQLVIDMQTECSSNQVMNVDQQNAVGNNSTTSNTTASRYEISTSTVSNNIGTTPLLTTGGNSATVVTASSSTTVVTAAAGALTTRPSKLITINVSKPLSIPVRVAQFNNLAGKKAISL